MKRLLLLGAICAPLAGCTTADMTTPQGLHIKYQNGLFQKKFSKLSVATNGVITIVGWQSEAATLLEAAASGVTKGFTGQAISPGTFFPPPSVPDSPIP